MSEQEKNILIVEDFRQQAKLWKIYLEEKIPKVKVDIANTAKDCIELFEKNHYSIIILDIMMRPIKEWNENDVAGGFWSGLKIYSEIEYYCKRKGIKKPQFIIVTAIKDARQHLYNGAHNFFKNYQEFWIDKPFNPETLEEMVLRCL
jgi:CheY-like chemotaxis protein